MITDNPHSGLTPITVRRYGGGGPCVVLLHGGPGAAGEMAPVAQVLKDRFAVIEPLQRKSGEIPLTVERHVLDLKDTLELSLKDGPVRILGFSWGAMLGLTYAARFPESVHSLMLIGCGTFDETSRSIYEVNIKKRMSPELQNRIQHVRDRMSFETDLQRRNLLFKEFGTIYTRLQSFHAEEDSPEDVLYYDELGFRETWEDVLSLQEKGIQPAEFVRITAPVVMIHGEDDPHPGSLIYQTLEPHIQNLIYIPIDQCGHKPWIECFAGNRFFDLLWLHLK